MKTIEPFTQVVHKAYASEAMVVIPSNSDIEPGQVVVRRAVNAAKFGVQFQEEVFWAEELETPVESIEREAEIFKTLNAKRDEINGKPEKYVPINHLN